MSETEGQYHPAVEKIMETSGPDVGRVKNPEVARTAADAEDFQRKLVEGIMRHNPDILKDAPAEKISASYQRESDIVVDREVAREAIDSSLINNDVDGMIARTAETIVRTEETGVDERSIFPSKDDLHYHVDRALNTGIDAVKSRHELSENAKNKSAAQRADEARDQIQDS